MADKQSVLLVDDHPLVRNGLARLIQGQEDLTVSAAVSTLHEARVALSQQAPHLLITDLTLPDGSGLELVKDTRAQHPKLPILVLSMHEEKVFAKRALQAGANGYVMKETSPTKILKAIRVVLDGKRHVSARMTSDLLSQMSDTPFVKAASPLAQLSDRELEVFELLGHGKASGEIAQFLGLSVRAVEKHRAQLSKVLPVNGGQDLIKRAIRWVEHREDTW